MDREKQGSSKCRKALIVKLGQIGDVIMAIPAVHALHQRGFEIDWVCGKAALPLLECYSWIRVIPADDKALFFGNLLGRIRSIVRLWRTLGAERYDLCAVLYYDKRYRLLTFPLRARDRLMLSDSSRATRLLPGRHHSDEYARILLRLEDSHREISMAPVPPDRLPPSPWHERKVARRIALVPGVAGHLLRQRMLGQPPEALRRWPIESFVALGQRLLERGWEVVIFGGADEAWVSERFQLLGVTDCINKLTLPQVVSACDDCDAVVSNDTGPFHLAGLSKTCLIGIFGPTDPATRVPRRSYSVGIWGGQGFACRPCYDGRNFAPCTFNGCMHQVTPELVLRVLDGLLSDRNHGTNRPWEVIVPEEGGCSLVTGIEAAAKS